MHSEKGLEVYTPQQQTSLAAAESIIIYGRAGVGKSRLALMLPETEKWGDVLYYAADDRAEMLHSIPNAARKRVHVVKPRGKNHLHNFQQFCMTAWEAKLPSCKTLIVDTFSTIAYRVIQQIANEGMITREEHFQLGDPDEDGWALPSRSDYQGLESACKGFIDILFDKQRDFNIIFVAHEDSKEVSKGVWAGGPACPGRRMLEDLPACFNTVIRLIKENMLVPVKNVIETKVVAITDHDGRYIAKIREGDLLNASPLGRVPLDRNPVNFWLKYDESLHGTQGNN